MATAIVVQRLARQQGDVLAAGAEGRQGDVGHVEAVEEILPKTPLLHGGDQILVAGADDPHLGGALTIFRQHLQQLGLQRLRQIPYLVEKQGRPLGLLEQAGLPILPKQLQIQRRPRQGSAVDGVQRLVTAAACLVQRLGHHPLAGT
ncbi:hypothetical protein D3C85_519290 [compost metagenome]